MSRRHMAWLLLILLLVPACSGTKAPTYQKSKTLMDTFVTITVVASSAEDAGKAIGSGFDRLEKFGNQIDFFSEKSELSMINRNAGIAPVHVSPETLYLIEKALYVAKRSGGAFDPTIGPVMKLWDFHKQIKPSDADIKKSLPLVSYQRVKVDRDRATVFLPVKGMLLDLGGIAKGYAADLAVETLKKQGIQAGIVAIAGDIRTFGRKPDGKPWNIGIRNPRQTGSSDEIIATIPLSGKAVSTAGDYERFFIMNGKRYHHIMDPATGYPAQGTRSVSVVADLGVYADGFDNAIFVLGPEKGRKLIEELGKEFPVDAFIQYADGSEFITPGIKGSLMHEKKH